MKSFLDRNLLENPGQSTVVRNFWSTWAKERVIRRYGLRNAPKLTVAAYTHFGATGLKGVETYYMVKDAWKRGYLQKVIAVSKKGCRYEFDLDLVETLPGESRLISGLLQIKSKAWKEFPSRWLGEMIFDHYAASRLTRSGDIIILTPGMIHAARRAKALGYRIFLYAATPDPRYLMDQIRAEREAFGLKGQQADKERSRMAARWVATLSLTDHLIAVSEFCKDTYVACGFPRERISVVPLGVALQRFPRTPPTTDTHFTCLFVGHVNGTTGIVKGLQYLLRAWCELNLKDATLVICGKIGTEAGEVIRRYEGRLDNVDFRGRVSNPAKYYRKASVFVLPSVAEGMAKVAIEAMATGRPVIVTPNCGAVARGGLDGFYVGPRDVEALKEKILYFYNDREEIARMGANASEQAQRFGWERFSLRIADILSCEYQRHLSDVRPSARKDRGSSWDGSTMVPADTLSSRSRSGI
jgi:glycosyltransferase involved in cell wall biosynthesis